MLIFFKDIRITCDALNMLQFDWLVQTQYLW